MIPLPAGPFEIIYADPAWAYRGREQFGFAGDVGVSTGVVKQYPTMGVGDIAALPVSDMTALDCLLALWVPSPLLPDGLRVMTAWGFEYATVGFVWDKQRINPGYYTMSQVELCLIGKHNRIPRPRGSRNERQFLSEPRGRHSAKPAEVRSRLERMFPEQRKVELFARERVAGWEAWGNEV